MNKIICGYTYYSHSYITHIYHSEYTIFSIVISSFSIINDNTIINIIDLGGVSVIFLLMTKGEKYKIG